MDDYADGWVKVEGLAALVHRWDIDNRMFEVHSVLAIRITSLGHYVGEGGHKITGLPSAEVLMVSSSRGLEELTHLWIVCYPGTGERGKDADRSRPIVGCFIAADRVGSKTPDEWGEIYLPPVTRKAKQ